MPKYLATELTEYGHVDVITQFEAADHHIAVGAAMTLYPECVVWELISDGTKDTQTDDASSFSELRETTTQVADSSGAL